jgi:hypothetical protein
MHQDAAASLSRAALLSDSNPAPMGSLGYVYARSMISLNVDTRLDPLRDDPQFQDLLRRIGFK